MFLLNSVIKIFVYLHHTIEYNYESYYKDITLPELLNTLRLLIELCQDLMHLSKHE